jgi:NAD+ synthase
MTILNDEILSFDKGASTQAICDGLKANLRLLRKRGLVIAISGGIDSSVSAALCVEAIGANKVHGLLLPESDSSSDSVSKGEVLAKHLGINYQIKNISSTLEAVGCYQQRDEAMQRTIPDYNSDWKSKIAIKGGQDGGMNHFNLIAQSPEGGMHEARMKLKEYLQIVAATNYKQRVRKMIEYYHADCLNYAVIGTPNRLEYDQGFFVKNGDGSADIKPIAHLYKSQVYALARHFNLPDEICNSIPTTDTYSLDQGQDEFYFALDYKDMDVALWCYNNDQSADFLAQELQIPVERAKFVYKDIESKRSTTAPLHWSALTIENVQGPIAKP